MPHTLASPAQGLHRHEPQCYNFQYFFVVSGLEELDLVDQTWLEGGLSALLLRTLAVDRRKRSESIEVAFDME